MNPTKLEQLQASVEETRTILESNDPSQLENLTRDQILGDLFYAGGLGYFAQYNGLSHIAALQAQGNHKLEFGYGSYGYEPNQDVFFGIPRGIKTGGAAFNIRFGNTVELKQGGAEQRAQFRFQTGLISSALEHAVPEQMFSDPDDPTDGVSAVKALQLAAQQGQKIYQIDSSNVNTVLAQTNLGSSIEDEIRSYVGSGNIAIAHQSNISVPGWSGAGYILLDQETGIGSYKITGGGNGGFLKNILNSAINKLMLIAGIWQGFAKNNPALAKLLGGSIGLVIGALTRIVKLLNECPTGIALIGTLLTIGWNILFLTINVALAASGAGALLLYPLAAMELYLEAVVIDKFIEKGCS